MTSHNSASTSQQQRSRKKLQLSQALPLSLRLIFNGTVLSIVRAYYIGAGMAIRTYFVYFSDFANFACVGYCYLLTVPVAYNGIFWIAFTTYKLKLILKFIQRIGKLLPVFRQNLFCSAVLTPQHYHCYAATRFALPGG